MLMTHRALEGGVALQAAAEPLQAPPGWLQAQETFHWVGAVAIALPLLYAAGLAYLFLMRFLAPGVTGRSASIVRERPFKSLLVGLLVLALMSVLARATAKAHGLIVVTLPLGVLLFFGGASAISQEIGARVFAMAGRMGSVLGCLAAGWAVAFLGSMVPVLGWVVGGLILLPLGLGGFLLAFFSRSGVSTAEPVVALPPGPAASPEEGAV